MTDKEIVLTALQNSNYNTGISKESLLYGIAYHYNVNVSVTEPILQECLVEGLVAVSHNRYRISDKGLKFLKVKIQGIEDDEPHTNKSPINWTKWGTIIAFLVGIPTFITFYMDKCRVNVDQQKQVKPYQNYDTSKQTANHVEKLNK